MDSIIDCFVENYNAVLVDSDCCKEYMNTGETINAALAFPDKKKNFALMSKYDFEAFTPAEKALLIESKEAPYEKPILVFYENSKGENLCKLINGMLSRIFELIDQQSNNTLT